MQLVKISMYIDFFDPNSIIALSGKQIKSGKFVDEITPLVNFIVQDCIIKGENNEFWEVAALLSDDMESYSERVYKEKNIDYAYINAPFHKDISYHSASADIYVFKENIKKGKNLLAFALLEAVQHRIKIYNSISSSINGWINSKENK